MSVARSPNLADIRRREDEADRKKVAAIVGAAVFLCCAAFALCITLKVYP